MSTLYLESHLCRKALSFARDAIYGQWWVKGRGTHAAVTANTSALVAFVKPVRQMESTKLKAAIIPSLAPDEVTNHSMVIDAMGNMDAKMLVIKCVALNKVFSRYVITPNFVEGLRLRWHQELNKYFLRALSVNQRENASSW